MKKYLLIGLLLLAMTFVACGTDETKDTDVNNPVKDSTEVEVPNDPVEPDNAEDPVKPDDTEEPVVEMVDWETWATQADNDEVCMVVWNETTGIQKILEPVPAGILEVEKYSYTVQEGDKIAIPKRNSIICVYVNLETRLEWDYSKDEKYMELEIKPGEITQIDIILNTESNPSKEYLFNF